jgi:L-Ala-D/L-Glu epimerase
MKITKIEVILLKIPYPHPFRIALAVMDSAQNIVVRVHTDSGLVGVGEGCPPRFVTGEAPETAFEAARLYAQVLLGRDPLEIDARLGELEHFMLKNSAVRCAYDLALHDLLAKHASLPLYALLGGTKQVLYSNRTIGMDTPEAMAAAAKGFAAQGAQSLKVKVGGGRAEDVARVRAVRSAVGAVIPFRLDANQGWDESTAAFVLNAVADCGVQVCEQPLPYWNIEGLVRLRGRSPVPIMADESIFDAHDAFRLASAGAVDYFNIKLAKCAGIRGALKISAIAEAAGIACMLGGMAESLIGVSAGAHLLCACPNIALADLDSPFHFAEDPTTGGVDFQPGGAVTLRDAPGHGADVAPAWLERSQKVTVE